MSETTRIADLPEFDITAHLEDDQAIAEYLTVVLEDDDPALLAAALGDIARARGMTAIARLSGLTREALYKALRADAAPRFDTINRVCRRHPEQTALYQVVQQHLETYLALAGEDDRDGQRVPA